MLSAGILKRVMIRIILLLWIGIAIGIKSSNGADFKLQCTFRTDGFVPETGGVYWRSVKNLVVATPYDFITGVVGTHLINGFGIQNTNDDVKGLDIHTQTCPFFHKIFHGI